MNEIHKKALEVAKRFKQAEADLILALQEVEARRVFVELGYTSTPVLTLANQDEWVEKAKFLSTRKLEEEVARVAPREVAPERIKFVAEDRLELRLGISKSLKEKLERVRDLESQRTACHVSIEETLEALLDLYLESKDPVKRAERVLRKKVLGLESSSSSPVTGHANQLKLSDIQGPIPAANRHQVQLRDGGRCTRLDTRGERCENRRWIDIHHVQPRSLGGTNALENLVTLCSAHHRMEHEQSVGRRTKGLRLGVDRKEKG